MIHWTERPPFYTLFPFSHFAIANCQPQALSCLPLLFILSLCKPYLPNFQPPPSPSSSHLTIGNLLLRIAIGNLLLRIAIGNLLLPIATGNLLLPIASPIGSLAKGNCTLLTLWHCFNSRAYLTIVSTPIWACITYIGCFVRHSGNSWAQAQLGFLKTKVN